MNYEYDGMRDHLKRLQEALSNIYKQLDIEAIKKSQDIISESLQPIAEAMSHIVTSEYQAEIEKFTKQLRESVTPLIEAAPQFEKLYKANAYYSGLREAEWPLFLIQERELYDAITENDRVLDKESIKQATLRYFDTRGFDHFLNKWRSSRIISSQRIPLLEEAITLYMQGKYYGCSSIIACQINGMIADIFAHHGADNEWLDKVKFAYDDINGKGDSTKITSDGVKKAEKHQLQWAATSVENSLLCWRYTTDYLYNIVLSSAKKDDENPRRNKACHGELFCSGTKECALKFILVSDILYELADEINRVYNIATP